MSGASIQPGPGRCSSGCSMGRCPHERADPVKSPSLLQFIFVSFVTATAIAAAPGTLVSILVRGTAALNQPIAVYNNWSAYDELSDRIELTEALAMKELG